MTILNENPELQDTATLAAIKRRTIILLLFLLPAIALTVWLVISQSRAMRVAELARQVIPATLTHDGRTWTSVELQFSELEMEILETRDYVDRDYTDGRGSPVNFCAVFSEDNRKGTHPPDVCLEGSGYRILSRHDRKASFDGVPLELRELVAVAPSGQYVYFVYFYKCGDVFTPSFYKQQVQIIWNGLTRQNASGALIRYATPMNTSNDLESARQRVDLLLAATFPSIRSGLNAQH